MFPDLRMRDSRLELLDEPELDPRDLRQNLREMARLNRLPGGVHESQRAIRKLLNGSPSIVLDVGAGSGDFAELLLAHRNGMPLRLVVSDVRGEILELARRRLRRFTDVDYLQADAVALPMGDEVVDITHASLLMHHLQPEAAVQALSEMRRVARRAVVINDLRRSPATFAAVALTVYVLTSGRFTRYDGPLSARRAYTLPELDDLADQAGLRPVWRSPAYLPRVVTVYE
jgi:ubiquinone/menaquinone biosynthesis C-methylase UbiE